MLYLFLLVNMIMAVRTNEQLFFHCGAKRSTFSEMRKLTQSLYLRKFLGFMMTVGPINRSLLYRRRSD